MPLIKYHTELEVFKLSMEYSMIIFNLTLSFPKEEIYSLTDQIRRSSRSICANISEAWYCRSYQRMFKHKLTIAQSETAETLTWLDYCYNCSYIQEEDYKKLKTNYQGILSRLVKMSIYSDRWIIKSNDQSKT